MATSKMLSASLSSIFLFSATSSIVLGSAQLPIQWVLAFLLGSKVVQV